MSFVDMEKGIAAIQTLKNMSSGEDIFKGIGIAAKAAGYSAMVDVGLRLRVDFNDAIAEQFLKEQGVIGQDVDNS